MRSLSVVIPTLNCAEDIHAHLESMQSWLDLAAEVVVVDSDSNDGTPEIIRKKINHPGLCLLNHPRGLYQSWNYAISQTKETWIYISTIGDTITRNHLLHLLDAGVALDADVVVSPPDFVLNKHLDMDPPVWPVHRILELHCIKNPTVIDPLAAFAHALRSTPNAILGSSASNIYRGDHLRARPFPVCFRMVGDTGWAIRHAFETRFCYTSRVGSVFHLHSDTYTCPDYEIIKELVVSLNHVARMELHKNRTFGNKELLDKLEDYLDLEESYKLSRAEWRLLKAKSRIPWFLRFSAIKARRRRVSLKRTLIELPARLDNEISKLPLLTIP